MDIDDQLSTYCTLTSVWDKRIKSEKVKKMITWDALWYMRPDPKTAEGRRILELNLPLIEYLETLDDIDYALEPVEEDLIELVPYKVSRQGVGISVDPTEGTLELGMYFYPCEYSEDTNRKLPPWALRVPTVAFSDTAVFDRIVQRYFLPEGDDFDGAIIPFSEERFAELQGNFMDDYEQTARICRQSVKGGNIMEVNNCERFLEFVRTAGRDRYAMV